MFVSLLHFQVLLRLCVGALVSEVRRLKASCLFNKLLCFEPSMKLQALDSMASREATDRINPTLKKCTRTQERTCPIPAALTLGEMLGGSEAAFS